MFGLRAKETISDKSATMVVETQAPATLPPGRRIYAIGDVHGCAARLAELHEAVLDDLGERPVPDAVLLHIGDLIDRGPDSAGTVALVADAPEVPGLRRVAIMGNHERMMLDAVDTRDPEAVANWMHNHADTALRSWGIVPNTNPGEWAARLPSRHLGFIRAMRPSYRAGGYFFTHAGVRPGVPLERQLPDDLIWIREPFLSSDADHGAVVVHGHTPAALVEIRPNRIGIDTGAVGGGPLTCAVLEADRIGFLTA